jgi:prolyl 4-hydroxylase
VATFPAQAAEALAAQGRVEQALGLLRPAAAEKDPDALFLLAVWRLSGQYIARDLAASRRLFASASAAGHPTAGMILAAFLANGTGGDADWPAALSLLRARAATDPSAADQLAILAAMDLGKDGTPRALPVPEPLSERPWVRRVAGLFSAAECAFLIRCAEPLLQPAMIVDPRTGRSMRDSIRISDVAAFPLALENPAIHALNRRIAALTGTQPSQGEPLQVLSYRPGQQYRAHVDALPRTDNQRALTILVSLNHGYDGGETHFVAPGLKVKGRKGDAILFRNVDDTGKPDRLSEHAGLPVTAGRKLIASRWIRERALDLS